MIRAMVVAILLLFAACTSSMSEDAKKPDPNDGRFQLRELKIDNVNTIALVDSRTGKVWVYRLDINTGRTNFVGLTVEGLVYSKKDEEEIDKQIHQWSVDGIIDKNVKNFKPMALSEWSYYLDASKAKIMNEAAKSREEAKL